MNHFRVLLCCTTLCAGGWAHGGPIASDPGLEFTAKVIAVLDGDTVLVRRNGSLMKIRLAEIDAPEKSQDYGFVSRDALADMVLHRQISFHTLVVDKYERTVAQLMVNGFSVNEEMVRRGMAWEYSNYHSDRRYIALQQEARRARRGLWVKPDPTPPWIWRKQHAAKTDPSSVLAPGEYTCGSKRHCSQMRSCEEAFYYFTACGVKALNPSGDDVPCKKLCASGS